MSRTWRLLAAIALIFCAPAALAQKAEYERLVATTTVTDAAPLVVTVTNPNHALGYLIITTAAEVGTASLAVTVAGTSALGDYTLCTLAAITTNTTTVSLLGSLATAAGGIANACDFPLPRRVKLTFTITGGTPSFDITADMDWLTGSAY